MNTFHFRSVLPLILLLTAPACLLRAQEVATELETVVVTGTRTERRLSDVPVRTEVVDRAEILKTQSRTLADAVEWTNGVRVENDCQNCNFSQVRLLGLQGNFTQILADGRPSLSSLASVYGIEQIPVALIDRIEIVKGGGSALYGPGAIAGVINIIPRTPDETGGYTRYGYDTMGAGPNHTFEAGADLLNSDQTAGVTLFGLATELSPVDINGDGFTEIGLREMWSGGLRAFWKPTEKTRLTLDYLFSDEYRRGGDRLDRPVTEALIAEAIDTRLHMGGLRWEEEVTDRFGYELNFSATYTGRDTYYGSGMDPNAFGLSESPVIYGDITARYKISETLRATGGIQSLYEKLEDQQPAYNRFTSQEIENYGVFGQLEWDPAARWNIVAGSRVDFNSQLDDPVISPRLAVKYDVTNDVAVRAGYSSGFRAPQVFDEDLHITQAGGEAQVIRSAPGLREETSRSFTLGAEWKPSFFGVDSAASSEEDPKNPVDPSVASERIRRQPLTLEANLFYTRLNDSFDVTPDDNPSTAEAEFTRVNAGNARVYGAELNLGYQIVDSLRLDLGYVEQRSRYDQVTGGFGSRNFDRTPERYGVLGLTWGAPWCEVFIGGKYTGPMEVPHFAGFIPEDRLAISPSFLTWDIALARSFTVKDTEVRITAGLKNIFNDYQSDLDRGPNRDSAYVYGPRFPRQFHVSVQWNF